MSSGTSISTKVKTELETMQHSSRVVGKEFKGLTIFISDLRNCTSREKEEARVQVELGKIRKKFSTKKNKKKIKVRSYERRKYILKVLYAFMLGYDIDSVSFSYMESVHLASSERFSEKQIGYLALGILMTEEHEMIPLIVNQMQLDLQNRNKFVQSLALTAVATIGSKEMAETLTPIINTLLLAPDTIPLIKKKAALSLLRLHRKYPFLTTPDQWLEKIDHLLKENDLGLLSSVMALMMFLIREEKSTYLQFIPQVIQILVRIVIRRDFKPSDVYHRTPNPWLQVSLLRFLRQFPVTRVADAKHLSRLFETLSKILMMGSSLVDHRSTAAAGGARSTVNSRNAANAVLFEAIFLIAGMEDCDPALVATCADLLGKYIQAAESNSQYLALEGMTSFVLNKPDTLPAIQAHFPTILSAMKSADISIRRRALDLLYHACDRQHSKQVVSELMTFLLQADFEFREELVLKIAILSERFAPNYAWYVDVIVQLIAEAGENVSDDIWHRLIHITTNHEDIQAHAAKISFDALQHPTWNETTLKLAGYILGEFGHLIADRPGSSPVQQFNLIHSKFYSCSLTTKALLLTTYVKFSNLYPEELAEAIGHVFRDHQDFIDPEIQQRACEYWQLSEFPDTQVITKVLDEMPPFPERTTTQKGAASGRPSNRTTEEREDSDDDVEPQQYSLSGSDSDDDRPSYTSTRPVHPHSSSSSSSAASSSSFFTTPPPPSSSSFSSSSSPSSSSSYAPSSSSSSSYASSSTLPAAYLSPTPTLPTPTPTMLSASLLPPSTDLLSLEPTPISPPISPIVLTSSPALASSSMLPTMGSSSMLPTMGSSPMIPSMGSSAQLGLSSSSSSSGVLKKLGTDNVFWRNMLVAPDGIIFENQALQIGIKSQYAKSAGRMMLYFGNSSHMPFDNFLTTIPTVSYLQCQLAPIKPRVEPKEQVSQMLQYVATAEFHDCPILHVEFIFQGQPVHLTIPLPIVSTKFIEPLQLSAAEFIHRWKQIPEPEKEKIVRFKSAKPIDIPNVTNLLQQGLHLQIISGVDPNLQNLVGAGNFVYNQNQSQFRVLFRMETIPEASSFRLSVRSESSVLAAGVASLIVDVLGVFSSVVPG